jgi:CheY-like chemotaxis protein
MRRATRVQSTAARRALPDAALSSDFPAMRKHLLEIVLVEDDEVEIEAIMRALKNLRVAHDLTVFRSGAGAIHSLRQQRQHLQHPYPFLLLLDLNIPDVPGLELLRRLRRDSLLKAALVFVLTNSDSEEDKLAAYSLHVAGYLLKSNLGSRYEHLTDLIHAYHQVVEFPNR